MNVVASRRSAVVVGGGIAGLVAARTLSRQSDLAVTLIEATARLGGKLDRTTFEAATEPTESTDGAGPLDLDVGAESMLARRPEGTALIADLGLTEHQVRPTGAKAQVLIDGQIRRLPTSAMGVPTDLDALAGYLSDEALARARREPDLPAPALASDVGIGAYVADRFGDEVTDRLLEPLLGGVYAGRSHELSFAAVNPALFARAAAGGSLLTAAQALAARRPAVAADTPVFAGLDGGVTGLVDALEDDLTRQDVEIRRGSPVRMVWPRAAGGYLLEVGAADAPELLDADLLVLATPAAASARLLFEIQPEASAELAEIPYASVAVITLIVRGGELSGSGLLVPPGELPTVKALTYSHNKWDWVAQAAARHFGEPVAVVRASVGRFGEAALLQLGDQPLVDRTVAELAGVPGWGGSTVLQARVRRWGGGLPQYLVGHRDRIGRIQAAMDDLDALAVCGAYLDGPGLPACIASGERAATQVLAGRQTSSTSRTS